MPQEYAKLEEFSKRGIFLNDYQTIKFFNIRGVGRTFLDYLRICEECLEHKGEVFISQDFEKTWNRTCVIPKEYIHNKNFYYGELIYFIRKYYPELKVKISSRCPNDVTVIVE